MKKLDARASKGAPIVTAEEIVKVFKDTVAFIQHQHNRFIVPDDFMEGHPEREKMVNYLKGLAWRGTESGAAQIAGVSLRKVREWREYDEFVEFEELADQACTDLVEEVLLHSAYVSGDKQMILAALKGRRPDKFSDRVEHTGPKGGPLTFQIVQDSVPRPKRLDD